MKLLYLMSLVCMFVLVSLVRFGWVMVWLLSWMWLLLTSGWILVVWLIYDGNFFVIKKVRCMLVCVYSLV